MSTTTVPIRPIGKGSLAKLWVGVGFAVLLAGGLAWTGLQALPQTVEGFLSDNASEPGVVTTDSGLQFKELTKGAGPSPSARDYVLVNYTGRLIDGSEFDAGQQVPMAVAQVVPGFSEGLQRMQSGGSYRLWIKPELGYGAEDRRDPQTGEVGIPGGSLLDFEVELLEFITPEQLQAMQTQGGAPPPGAMPGGSAGPPPGMMPE